MNAALCIIIKASQDKSRLRFDRSDRLTWTTVDLVLVVRTVYTAVADRVCRYAAAVVAGEAVLVASVARAAGLSGIRCKMERYIIKYEFISKLKFHKYHTVSFLSSL